MNEPVADSISDSHKLIVRGIEAVEGTKNGLSNVEKAVDELKAEVARLVAGSSGTETALRRLATVEEGRLQDDRRLAESRAAWLSRIWDAKPIQYALIALVVGLAQFCGVRMADSRVASATVEIPALRTDP